MYKCFLLCICTKINWIGALAALQVTEQQQKKLHDHNEKMLKHQELMEQSRFREMSGNQKTPPLAIGRRSFHDALSPILAGMHMYSFPVGPPFFTLCAYTTSAVLPQTIFLGEYTWLWGSLFCCWSQTLEFSRSKVVKMTFALSQFSCDSMYVP